MPTTDPPVPPLRRASPADAAALAALAERTFRATYGAKNLPENVERHCATHFGPAIQRAELEDAARETWVADAGDRLAGYAQLKLGGPPVAVAAARPIEILRFYLDVDQHGRGLAYRMMDHVLARAAALGRDLVWLGVWEKNPRAIAFYERVGFRAIGEQVFVVGDDAQRDLVLCRPPASSA
jgi:ribosomal protein S18 acetylase RimI-like enzyme